MAKVLFITGTDTGVGKTVASVLLTRHWLATGADVVAVKPFCSGGRDDAEALREAQGGNVATEAINPWFFPEPLTPMLAARRAGCRLKLADALRFLRQSAAGHDGLLVEGAGGLLSPLGEDFSARELIHRLQAIPVVVCPDRLGAINQARLVFAALGAPARAKARLVLVSQPSPDSSTRHNAAILGEILGDDRVFRLPWLSQPATSVRIPPGIRALLASV